MMHTSVLQHSKLTNLNVCFECCSTLALMEPIVIVLAFVAGLLTRQIGYPPLLGFLLAGFIAHGLGIGSGEALAPIADAGINLLLFTIGLKLNLKALTPRYVWGSAVLHMLVAVPLTTAVIMVVGLLYEPLAFDSITTAWTLAFALSFSSTVLAIKLFEERGESGSYYASIAIGVLIVQDVFAVLYVVFASGHYPSPWALLLLGLPLLRPVFFKILQAVAHGELLLLAGVAFALGAAALFELVEIKGGLGALLIGMLLAKVDQAKAREIHDRLVGVKNLLLIGFFVQIGYYGIPSLEMMAVAITLALLIVLRPIIYFSLMIWFGLRARTAWLTGLSLFSYSEFGLIVAAIAVETGVLGADWVTTLALAMSLSFFLATPINNKAKDLYRRNQARLHRLESPERLPEEAIGSLGGAETAILGMGRIGRGAYDALREAGHEHIVGIEENYATAERLNDAGYRCVHGDAADRDFWERTGLASCRLILVSLKNHQENLSVVRLAHDLDCSHALAIATRYPDEKAEFEELGCAAYYLYADVGRDFALYSVDALQPNDKPGGNGGIYRTDSSLTSPGQ